MKKIELIEAEYEIMENNKDALDENILQEKFTDFFQDYDYIVGDWAYDKLRLKGFCEKENKMYKPFNDKEQIKNYIETKCAYGCKYFILKKIK